MAVSHTYHCASDQLQGGKAGKGVLTLCHSTVMAKWANMAVMIMVMCRHADILVFHLTLGLL